MLNLTHAPGLLIHPNQEWQEISLENNGISGLLTGYVLILVLIGSADEYYGTTTSGWQIGSREAVKLMSESAMTISILNYLAVVSAVIILGLMVSWMCKTYGGNTSINRCYALST